MNRKHWFHCSSKYHGESFVADRRTPAHMSSNETRVPRLCVAPPIVECFAAVLFNTRKPVFCYRTEAIRRSVAPRGVWDSVVTGERWLIPPVKMILFRTISAEEVRRAQEAVTLFHKTTRRNSSLKIRVAQLAIAAEVLGDTREKRKAKRICKVVSIDDPEWFVLCEMENNITCHASPQSSPPPVS